MVPKSRYVGLVLPNLCKIYCSLQVGERLLSRPPVLHALSGVQESRK